MNDQIFYEKWGTRIPEYKSKRILYLYRKSLFEKHTLKYELSHYFKYNVSNSIFITSAETIINHIAIAKKQGKSLDSVYEEFLRNDIIVLDALQFITDKPERYIDFVRRLIEYCSDPANKKALLLTGNQPPEKLPAFHTIFEKCKCNMKVINYDTLFTTQRIEERDHTMNHYYMTGDTHGGFSRIEDFCFKHNTTKDDVLIILGDAGINYLGVRDIELKRKLASLPITLFCIHGNHEQRPESLPYYHLTQWQDGNVYIEDAYPNLLFAKDGEIYNFNGHKTIVIGGAYSVDKDIRIANHWGWWENEQPSEEIKAYTEAQLEKNDWTIDMVFTHTVPLKYEPVECFLPGIDQSRVDKTTEIWLDTIENKLNYKKWYAGHYHTEKKVSSQFEILFENYIEIL
ncbi:MAG: metallophosphoesterase [Lachnospiraceae bacterium]|nr:metallophosphoesterase [Lachnospiraceae bacterium]